MESLPSCISNAKLSVVISAGKIQSGQDRCRISLLGRVFWPLPKPLYALHHDLARQWKIRPREVQVFDAGHGLIQFLFSSEDVKNVVLTNQPWCYKNHILNLIPWETPSQSVVDRLQFMALTVQLLEVPQHCLTTEFGKEVMAPVGEVLSADMYTTRPNGAGRPFIKVVVRMDLMASFPGKVEVVVPNAPSFDVLLGYEGLPALCFLCGLLGHIQRSCGHASLISPTPGLWGMWMLAKRSCYLLEDITVATPRLSSVRPPKPLRLLPPPPVIHPAHSAASSGPSSPNSAPTPDVPLINGMCSSRITSIHLLESSPLSSVPTAFPLSAPCTASSSIPTGFVFDQDFPTVTLSPLDWGNCIRYSDWQLPFYCFFPPYDDFVCDDLRLHARIGVILAACDAELEDMLLVDRKRRRYDDDPMEDIPPKRLRSALDQRR
ncbi:hypothetical protein LINGRAHAP2_LOCUS6550 [Linum grandiflorum]